MQTHLRRGAADLSGTSKQLQALVLLGEHVQSSALRNQSAKVSVDLTGVLYRQERPSIPPWAAWLWFLPYAQACVFGLLAFAGLWGSLFLAACLCLAINSAVQIKLHPSLAAWRRIKDGLQAANSAAIEGVKCSAFSVVGSGQCATPSLEELRQNRLVFRGSLIDVVPALREYTDLLLLQSYTTFIREIDSLESRLESFKRAYEYAATAEMNLCLAEYLREQRQFCWSSSSPERTLEIADARHPLLTNANPLTCSISSLGLLVTGKNGVGKSTFLRTIGINVVLSRAFGFCFATTAAVPDVAIFSSISFVDSLLDSNSLYMVEMQRAEQLVDIASAGTPALYLIDEMFRATNNGESIAAAAATKAFLARNGLLICATHNSLLAGILSRYLVPYQLRAANDHKGVQISPGVCAESNGVAMMNRYNFPTEIVERAEKVSVWYGNLTKAPISFPVV
jgi:hypothetical protein